jgi:ABC-2 type transport system permease protein
MSALSSTVDPGLERRRDLSLLLWQVVYEQRAFWRNRARGIFTFVFPLMFLVVFGSLYGGRHIASLGGIAYDQYFVPGILAYGVIATTYVNLAIGTAILRDEGVLKRMQGTPLPRWAYVGARILSAVIVVVAMTALTLGIGAAAYGIQVRASTLPAAIAVLVLGAAAFTTLGIGVTRFIKNAEAAPVIVNLTVLPLTFISGVWFTTSGIPAWLHHVARVFPIQPLADGLQHAFDPRVTGTGFSPADLRILAVWCLVGIAMMVRFLRRPQGEPA